MALSKELRALLFGNPWGEVYPPKPAPPPPVVDGRTVALRILKKYICELTFYRPGGKDKNGVACGPIPFKVLPENVHIEWPDDPVDLDTFPSIVFLNTGSPADYDAIGLTSNLQEETRDVYAPGTVVQEQNEYKETFALEIWADSKPQRRSLYAGLESSLVPTEQMSGIRFRMPDYYDQLVCFELNQRMNIDDDFATKNRRKGQLIIEMRFNIVALVNYSSLEPQVRSVVDVDESTGEEFVPSVEEDEPEDD